MIINFSYLLLIFLQFRIQCPENGHVSSTAVNMWSIMSKVRLEAFMWVRSAFTLNTYNNKIQNSGLLRWSPSRFPDSCER